MESWFSCSPWKDGLRIDRYLGEEWPEPPGKLRIPDRIRDLPVRSIGKKAFEDSSLEILELPGSVREICDGAFDGCLMLEQLNLQAGLISFHGGSIARCSVEELTLPETVTELPEPLSMHGRVTVKTGNPVFLSDGFGVYRKTEEAGLCLIYLYEAGSFPSEYRLMEGTVSVLPGVLLQTHCRHIHLAETLRELPEGELSPVGFSGPIRVSLPAHQGFFCLEDGCLYRLTDNQERILLSSQEDRDCLQAAAGTARIGKDAFAGRTFREIRLPETVREICPGAFDLCHVRLILLPDGKTELPLPAENELRKLFLTQLQEDGTYDFERMDQFLIQEYMNSDRLELLVNRLEFQFRRRKTQEEEGNGPLDKPAWEQALIRRCREVFVPTVPALIRERQVNLFERVLALGILESRMIDEVHAVLESFSVHPAAREMTVSLLPYRRKKPSGSSRFSL